MELQRSQHNPFTPVFGKVPAYLAGRERITDEIVEAFDEGGTNPSLCSVFTGARGTGKTALLTYLGRRAERSGWVVANITAIPGMLDDILQRTEAAAAHLVSGKPARKLSGAELAAVGSLSRDNAADMPGNWRTRMEEVIDQLAETDTGLLITVDEIDNSAEMVQLVTTYQHFVREERKVALLMAGLPYRISGLLTGKSTSFMRRAARYDLGSIPPYEVEEAFRLTVEDGGKTIQDDALAVAVQAIGGFPFMFQLVGYRAWNAARGEASVEVEHVERGARLAQAELEDRVFNATYGELSKGDRAFLRAMARDEAVSTRADIAVRLGRSASYVSTYKKRLLEAGVIEELRDGALKFSLPGFGDYVRSRDI